MKRIKKVTEGKKSESFELERAAYWCDCGEACVWDCRVECGVECGFLCDPELKNWQIKTAGITTSITHGQAMSILNNNFFHLPI